MVFRFTVNLQHFFKRNLTVIYYSTVILAGYIVLTVSGIEYKYKDRTRVFKADDNRWQYSLLMNKHNKTLERFLTENRLNWSQQKLKFVEF